MPDTACLHIQAREADPVRVVTLPGLSVRIGRAAYCEVRLPEPGFAAEECQLKRRGQVWHLVPVARPGKVWIDDHPVEHSQPIPFGVPFRVGDLRLMLHPSEKPDGTWDAFERTTFVDVPTTVARSRIGWGNPPQAEPRRVKILSNPVPLASGNAAPVEEDPLTQLKARQEQRANWLRSREEERRWQERWRAAGDRLRSRGAAVPPTTKSTPQEPKSPRRPEPPTYVSPPRHPVAGERAPARSHEPARPAPIPTRETPSAIAPVPVFPVPVAPPPTSRPGRTSLAHADWGQISIARRPGPRTVDESRRPSIAPTTPPSPEPTGKRPTPSRIPRANPPENEEREREGEAPHDPSGQDSSLASVTPEFGDPSEILPHGVEPTVPVEGVAETGSIIEGPGRGVVIDENESRHSTPITALDRTNLRCGATAEVPPEPGAPQTLWGELLGDSEGSWPTSLDPKCQDQSRESTDPECENLVPLDVTRPPCDESWVVTRYDDAIGIQVRGWHEDGQFVAEMNRVRDDAGAGPQIELGAATSVMANGEEVAAEEAPRIRPSPGRRRRAATRPGLTRGRLAQDASRSAGAANPDASLLPPHEDPVPGTGVTDPPRRLPTAREILAAQCARRDGVKPARPVLSTSRRIGRQPLPTTCIEPAHWKVPLWLGWAPAVALAFCFGVVGIGLAWSWSIEAEHAGFLANRMARVGAKAGPLPEWVTPPDLKWWKTTPEHLLLWAMERDRTVDDPAASEEAQEFLSAASQGAPMHARVRFARARSGGEEEQGAALASSLGSSRDVVTLAWTAHQLLAAGKKEAALETYHAALVMASKADPARVAAPRFNDDSKVRRYALPAEDLIGPIVFDMAAHDGWTYAEWSTALPDFAVVPLAAARALRERSSPDALSPLEAIIDKADLPPPDGVPVAVHIAAQAEAFALMTKWDEAEARYRQAIELMPNLAIRRSWWMNLADIAQRLNNESNRQKALEAAKGMDPNDEITRRASELLRPYGVRTETFGTHASRNMTANQ